MGVSVKSGKDRSGTGKPDSGKVDTVNSDIVNSDVEKADEEKKDSVKQDIKEQNIAKQDIQRQAAEIPGEENRLSAEAAGAEETDGQEAKPEKDGIAQLLSWKLDDGEEEGEDWENDDPQEDWEEESEPSRPWVIALVFLGMVFAAACICVMLWTFTHSDRQEENKNVFAGSTETPWSGDGLMPGGPASSGTGDLSLENQGSNVPPGSNSAEPDPPVQASELNRVTTQDGRVIIFSECDDIVTPKEYVNLRTEPSTSQGEATVGCMLNHGETAHRTGISEEMGWSRVEYNDQILYVISSFVNVVTDGQAAE